MNIKTSSWRVLIRRASYAANLIASAAHISNLITPMLSVVLALVYALIARGTNF